MRYRSIARVLALALAFAWATAATAQTGTGTPLSQRALEGRVVSVDSQGGSITVDSSGRVAAPASDRSAGQVRPADVASTTKLFVPPHATVVRDGLNVRADEVRPGDEVRASFLTDDLTRTHPWQLEVRSRHGRDASWGVGTGG